MPNQGIKTKKSREIKCQSLWVGLHKIAETRNDFDGITRTLTMSRDTDDRRNLCGTNLEQIFETNYK